MPLPLDVPPRDKSTIDPQQLLDEFRGLHNNVSHYKPTIKVNEKASISFMQMIANGQQKPSSMFLSTFMTLKDWAGVYSAKQWLQPEYEVPERASMSHANDVLSWADRCIAVYSKFADTYPGERVRRCVGESDTEQLRGVHFKTDLVVLGTTHAMRALVLDDKIISYQFSANTSGAEEDRLKIRAAEAGEEDEDWMLVDQ